MLRKIFFPLAVLSLFGGCCSCCSSKNGGDQCNNPFKPPLNCRGNAYDGSSAPCYFPPGPFWCCLPGPGVRCRDPYLKYYEAEHADCIGRHVADPDYALYENADQE